MLFEKRSGYDDVAGEGNADMPEPDEPKQDLSQGCFCLGPYGSNQEQCSGLHIQKWFMFHSSWW